MAVSATDAAHPSNATPAEAMVLDWLERFGAALEYGDYAALVQDLFNTQQCSWRDLAAFTWNIVTMEDCNAIRSMLESTAQRTRASGWRLRKAQDIGAWFRLRGGPSPKELGSLEPPALEQKALDAGVEQSEIRRACQAKDAKASLVSLILGVTAAGFFEFETAVGRAKGYVRLRDGKCYTIFTVLEELRGFEELVGLARPFGTVHGAVKGRQSHLEERQWREEALGTKVQPFCLIIGGGQAGICLGARLKQLGVPAVIVEKNERAGDSWRNRYKSLCLHDPVWANHLPYIPFPDHWPVFTPKDLMGDWLEMYTKVMELTFWGSTECCRAKYNFETEQWTVLLDRKGFQIELHPQHLIFATGMSGKPQMPEVPGKEEFKGTLLHSFQFQAAEPYAGKHCVVMGSNNSAHDIAAALWEADAASVTMIQRSSSHVSFSGTLINVEHGLRDLAGAQAEAQALGFSHYSEWRDFLTAATPYSSYLPENVAFTNHVRRRDAAFYSALEAKGFMLDHGDDGSGLGMKYLRRGSGYYIDVGASQLIIDDKIALQAGVTVDHLKALSLMLSNGKELHADLLVCATGYGPMNEWVAELISREAADRVGKVWGLGSSTKFDPGPWEGEERNMWKPTRHPGLWFTGGNLAQNRFYSKTLALQLKARFEGLTTPVFSGEPSMSRL